MRRYRKYLLVMTGLWFVSLPWTMEYLGWVALRIHPRPTYHNSVDHNRYFPNDKRLRDIKSVRLGLVSCGPERLEETLTLVKSAIVSALRFQLPVVELIIFTDDESLFPFDIKLGEVQEGVKLNRPEFTLRFEIRPLVFPPGDEGQEWSTLFRPCAAQRLFLPWALPHVPELLYLDTDLVILDDLRILWASFDLMNATQHSGLTPEHEAHVIGWYNRFAKHPYYPPLGVNSGVMLMNLTRLREFDWEGKVTKYYKEYRKKLVYGDQDIINIVFHFYPETLMVLPCAFNYRPDHCIYDGEGACRSALSRGISILHGNRRVFQPDSKLPIFHTIYAAFQQLNLSSLNLETSLIQPLKMTLDQQNSAVVSGCGHEISQNVFKSQK